MIFQRIPMPTYGPVLTILLIFAIYPSTSYDNDPKGNGQRVILHLLTKIM